MDKEVKSWCLLIALLSSFLSEMCFTLPEVVCVGGTNKNLIKPRLINHAPNFAFQFINKLSLSKFSNSCWKTSIHWIHYNPPYQCLDICQMVWFLEHRRWLIGHQKRRWDGCIGKDWCCLGGILRRIGGRRTSWCSSRRFCCWFRLLWRTFLKKESEGGGGIYNNNEK